MIKAAIAASSKGLEARLTARARVIGQAYAQGRRAALQGAGRHWRNARLLWPLFARDR